MFRILSLCALALALIGSATPARADHDVVQFGSTIHVPRETSIHDAVCFFCSVDADGTIEGDVVVFFGNVHIAHAAQHDVVNFFGNVTADSNATLGHDLVTFFGTVRLGENVSVGQDMVAMFGTVQAAPTATVAGDRVIQPGWVFWGPLIFLAVIFIVVIREIRDRRRRAAYFRGFPFPPRP